MKDVKQHHANTCPNFNPSLKLSLDGIQESKSSSISADVYSVSFKGCRTVYPIRIIRPINKYKVDEQENIGRVISDINENDCHLYVCVCDNPKRSNMRCALCSSATYACEYCESRAVYVYKENSNKSKGHLAWPYSTANGPKRTRAKIIEITTKIEEGENLTRDESKGIWGTSHLLHQPNFNFVDDIPCEYMHSGCLGVVKRITCLTFNVGEVRERKTKRKLSNVSTYNRLVSTIKAVREFNRRFRNLDYGVFKAQEYRNLILFFFPIVISSIPEQFERERKTWFQLAFIMRACVLPNKQYEQIPPHVINSTADSFYKNYEQVYGENNCTYSIHIISNHIQQIRGNEPLTSKSAFMFENFYSEMKNLFQPGTISPSKQIIQNCYMKRLLESHNCEKTNFF